MPTLNPLNPMHPYNPLDPLNKFNNPNTTTTKRTTTPLSATSKNDLYGITGKKETVNGITYNYAGPQYTSQMKNIYTYLYKGIGKQIGINNVYGVVAVMGNMSVESGLKPGRVQSDFTDGYTISQDYTKAVDNGSRTLRDFATDSRGYGLCQWTYYTRKENLYKYGSSPIKQNFSIGSWQRQVGFCLYEMKNHYSSTWTKVRNANKENLYEVVEYVCKHYEQPADQSDAQIRKRYRKALYCLKKCTNIDVDLGGNDGDDNDPYGDDGGFTNQVFTPSAVIGASKSAAAYKESPTSGTAMAADLYRLENLIAKDQNAKAAKKTAVKKLKANFNSGKLTSISSAGSKSKLATTLSKDNISIERIYDFYLTANNIFKDYKKPTSSEAKKIYTILSTNIPNRYEAAKLKYYSIKEKSNSIFETSIWTNNMLPSLMEQQSELEDKKSDLSKLDEEISSIIEDYIDKINQENNKMNELEIEIADQTKLIQSVLPSYNIITKENDKYTERINNINNNLNNNFKLNFSNNYKYWNQNIIDNPQVLLFWFDFLDTKGDLEEYSVSNIGSRTKAINDSNVNAIYYKDTPQIIYYSNSDEIINYDKTGYNYVNISGPIKSSFVQSTQNISAKEMVDDCLYQYGYCTENITLATVPIYYLEPNTRVFIYDEVSHLEGEFLVNKLTIPITFNGNMSIEATKAPERLY